MGTTHMILTGGTLNIQDYDSFYDYYLKSTQRLFLVEKIEGVFKLFFDIDYVGPELDFIKLFLEICKIVNAGKCHIARADPRITEKGLKYGFHLIWPQCDVTKPRAAQIRQRVLNEFGPEWSNIIDGIGSGLRMLWSYKVGDGSTCYVPYGTITEKFEFIEFENRDPSIEFLKMFSIKSKETIKSIEPFNSTDNSSLENFIRINIRGQENLKITGCKPSRNNVDVCIFTNSRYCANIRREHKSNHVYFIIKGSHIFQRCTDCDCSKYKGRMYLLPKTIKELYSLYLKC